MSKQQVAIFERAMRMFSPFYSDEPAQEKHPEPRSGAQDAQIAELRARLNNMQKQLDDLVAHRGK